jgi:hypothetical protein
MKILVAGWFSFEGMGATAGDLLSKDVVCNWLAQAGYSFDVAMAPPFQGGVYWQTVNPDTYTHVIFVCGPFGNGQPVIDFLENFKSCKLIGLNLTMLQDLSEWNPFDILFERDSSEQTNPDISIAAPFKKVPIVGLIQSHKQKEYRDRALQENAHNIIHSFLKNRELAVVEIDTRLDENKTGLRTPAEIESLIARMDVAITTRLHGTVLALKHGVPVIPIDPIKGGAKIKKQVKTLGWPIILYAESLTQDSLTAAFDFCLKDEARRKARECVTMAQRRILEIQNEFILRLKEFMS